MEYNWPNDVPDAWKTPVETLCDRLNRRLANEYWDDVEDSLPDCERVGEDEVYGSVVYFFVIDGEAVAYDGPNDWVYPVKSMGGIPRNVHHAYARRGLL